MSARPSARVSLTVLEQTKAIWEFESTRIPLKIYIFLLDLFCLTWHTARKSSTDRQSHQLKIKSNLDAPPGTRSLPVPRSVLGSESTEFENAFSSQRLEVSTCAQTDISDTYHSVSLGHYKSNMLPMEPGALRLALLPRKQLQCDWQWERALVFFDALQNAYPCLKNLALYCWWLQSCSSLMQQE